MPRVRSSTNSAAPHSSPRCGRWPAGRTGPGSCAGGRCAASQALGLGAARATRRPARRAGRARPGRRRPGVRGAAPRRGRSRSQSASRTARAATAGSLRPHAWPRRAGDHERAIALLDEAEGHYRPGYYPNVRPIAAVRARVWIAAGDLARAADWADDSGVSLDRRGRLPQGVRAPHPRPPRSLPGTRPAGPRRGDQPAASSRGGGRGLGTGGKPRGDPGAARPCAGSDRTR